jgi:GcrA cell cycle regulator
MPESLSRRRPESPWTAARIAQLRARWSQGASARQIARELGAHISRDSVLGKIHRLGIASLSPFGGGGKRFANRKNRHAATRAGPPLQLWARRGPLPAWVLAAEPYVDDPRVDAGIPPWQRRSLLELSSTTCRWPVGDPAGPGFFYCGAEPLAGKPYCAAHCARARRPEPDAPPSAPSARRRRAMLRYSGIATCIRLGGETAIERRWNEEVE